MEEEQINSTFKRCEAAGIADPSGKASQGLRIFLWNCSLTEGHKGEHRAHYGHEVNQPELPVLMWEEEVWEKWF